MSLKHALLGILAYQPMTGYELKQFFDSTVQHFWNAELSQIYPTLKTLEESGWVEKEVIAQETRPSRKVYEITAAGREEFARWVREPQMPADMRDPFCIKVFFGTEVPLEDVLIALRRQMDEQQMILAYAETNMRDRIRNALATHADTRHGLFWTLTLELSIAYRKMYIEWCERSMRLLEEGVLGQPDTHKIEHELDFPHQHADADAG